MVPITVRLAHKDNYGSERKTSLIKYIVIHYTGNDGDSDEGNANYFKNRIVKASAHYFVDGDSITQSVPDDHVAWSVGGNRYASYKQTGGGEFHGLCTNKNSISIELCDEVKDGKVYPSAKTIANALELTKLLMKKYGIKKENVIRHFDVTGKLCPAYWAGTPEKNKLWETEFWGKLGGASVAKPAEPVTEHKPLTPDNAKAGPYKPYAKTWTVTASALNMRLGASTSRGIVKTLKRGETVTCYGYYTQNGATIWLYVKDKTGATGYCSKKYLK